MIRKFGLFACLPIAIAAVVLVALLGPLWRMRFSVLRSSRVGHFVAEPEAYLCKRKAGLISIPPGCTDVFFFETDVCNMEIARQWQTLLHVLPFPRIGYLICRLIKLSPYLSNRHLIPDSEFSSMGEQVERAIQALRPHLAVPDHVNSSGAQFLSEVAHCREIVCIHVRDAAYLSKTYPHFDYSYHNYRDWDLATLAPTVHDLAHHGFFIVRMGSVASSGIPANWPSSFDYANSPSRSDAMDLFLAARCRLWIGSASGLVDLPAMFKRPLVIVNHVSALLKTDPIITYYQHSLWLFKKFYSESRRRLLTYREAVEAGVTSMSSNAEFARANIALINNSPEEIRQAAQEMLQRLAGTWKENPEAEILQRKFWEIWGAEAPARAQFADVRVGSQFLLENRPLFE